MRVVIPILAVAVAAMSTQAANAQIFYPGGGAAGGYGGYGYGYGYNQGGWSSTGYESRMKGYSDAVRAQADSRYTDSETYKNYLEADKMELDNRVTAKKTYIDLRRMEQQYYDEQRARRVAARKRSPWSHLPETRVSESQLDSVTGEIHWPTIISKTKDLDSYRKKLDELFAQRALYSGGIGSENYMEIKKTSEAMSEELRTHIHDWDTGTYLAAYNFIKGLSNEAKYSVK